MRNTITVIGAGNGGQALAASAAMQGFSVCLYNRTLSRIGAVVDNGEIRLTGKIQGTGHIDVVTDDIKTAVEYSGLLLVAVTADAHREIAARMLPYLRENQIIVLSPGRTGGVFEIRQLFKEAGLSINVYLAEAQTLVFACRLLEPGVVNVIGIKDRVLLAGEDKNKTALVINELSRLYPCFVPARSLFETSLENFGSLFHTCILLFNAATIERGSVFYFYRDMTEQIARFIERLDRERLRIGEALGMRLLSAEEWISHAYSGIAGKNLLEKVRNNPAYNVLCRPRRSLRGSCWKMFPRGLCRWPPSENCLASRLT